MNTTSIPLTPMRLHHCPALNMADGLISAEEGIALLKHHLACASCELAYWAVIDILVQRYIDAKMAALPAPSLLPDGIGNTNSMPRIKRG